MSIGKQSEEIVGALMKELGDRCGINNVLERIDAEVMNELHDKLCLIVRRILERGHEPS
jgi:hypothetical protein